MGCTAGFGVGDLNLVVLVLTGVGGVRLRDGRDVIPLGSQPVRHVRDGGGHDDVFPPAGPSITDGCARVVNLPPIRSAQDIKLGGCKRGSRRECSVAYRATITVAHPQRAGFRPSGGGRSGVGAREPSTLSAERRSPETAHQISDVSIMETRARKRGSGGGGEAAAGESSGWLASGGHEPKGPPVDSEDDAPSKLLGPLLEEWRDPVLVKHVLVDPTDCAMLTRVAKPWLAVLVANNLPRAGNGGAVKLKLVDFIGSVERLAWAKDNGCPWDTKTCMLIARSGQLEVLRWAREHGCDWDEWTCARAAGGGHLAVLRWAREHHCPWDSWTCRVSALGGHLAVLVWAREHGCQWNSVTCARAAAGEHLEVLQWAREHHCPWDSETCERAAGGGHLKVLQWAREHDCPWDETTCAHAALGGHLEVLKWAREHHCPWDQATCFRAAEGGHLEVLQWARANDCPWDAGPCVGVADARGHVDVARWVRAQAP